MDLVISFEFLFNSILFLQYIINNIFSFQEIDIAYFTKEKSEAETNLEINLNPRFDELQNLHEKAKTNYNNFMKTLFEQQEKFINSFENNTNIKRLINRLKTDYEIEISQNDEEMFGQVVKKFVADFKELTNSCLELERKSNEITVEFDKLINVCDILEKMQNNFVMLIKSQAINNKIWDLFVYYHTILKPIKVFSFY